MRRLLIFLACSFASQAAITNVQVSGVTSTQAVISACDQTGADITIEVAEAAMPDTGTPAYTPLVYDVDPAKFTNANSAQLRPGTIRRSNCYDMVIGKQGAFAHAYVALDGWIRERVLQQNWKHYYRLTGGGGSTATGTFTTGMAPLGNTYSRPIPGNINDPQHPFWPQIDWTSRTQILRDPQTGIAHKRMSFPGQNGNSSGQQGGGGTNTWQFTFGTGSSWTNPADAILTSGTGATITGSQAPLLLSFNNPTGSGITAFRMNVTCSMSGSPTGADKFALVAVAPDGVSDYGPPIPVDCTLGGTQFIGDSITYNTPGSLGYLPSWITPGQRAVILSNPGSNAPVGVNISGTAISLLSSVNASIPQFAYVGKTVFLNTGLANGGYQPVQITSQTNNYTINASSAITGAWSGNGTIVSCTGCGSSTPTPTFTTAGAHQFLTGDAVTFTLGGTGPAGTVWYAQVTGSTTFTVKDVNGINMDGSNIGGCCAGASVALANTMLLPQTNFRVRKQTSSANTLSFRATFSVITENSFQLNGGGGGVESCVPRGIPDGMVINTVDASGNVTFLQTDAPHGFTIGSSVPMLISGTDGSRNIDGAYTANIVDNTHGQINSWSGGAWTGHAMMAQPGANVGYLCNYINTGSSQVMTMVFPATGEVRSLGYLVYPGDRPIQARFILNKNPVLIFAAHLTNDGNTFAGGYYYRTRDIGMQTDAVLGSIDWVSIKTGVFTAIKAFEPLFDPAVFGVPIDWDMVDQDHLLLQSTASAQDSIAWSFVLDIGGNPIAASSTFSYPPARFGNLHGNIGARSEQVVARAIKGAHIGETTHYGGRWTLTLKTNMTGPPFSACPASILTGGTFPATTGILQCTTIQVDSTTPVALDPSGQNNGPLVPGDVLDMTGENARVIASPDSTHLIVQRQYSPDQYLQSSCSGIGGGCNWTHNINDLLVAASGATDYTLKPYAEQLAPITWWDFHADPHGTNAADPAGQDLPTATIYSERAFEEASHFDFKGHVMLNDDGGDVTPGGGNAGTLPPGSGRSEGVRVCPTSDQRTGCQPVFTINTNPAFSGLYGEGGGNNADHHPSLIDPDSNFAAVNPITGQPAFPFHMDATDVGISDQFQRSSALASGATQVFKLTLPESADNKRLPLHVNSSSYPLTDVSAPGRQLADNNTDQYHFCVAVIANDCWTGSSPGDRFANVPYTLRHYFIPGGADFGDACTPAAAGGVTNICAYLNPPHMGQIIQYGMQSQDSTGELSRAITFGLAFHQGTGGNPNARVIPSGDWAMLNSASEGVSTIWLARIGQYPPRSSVNRTDFMPVPIQVPPRAGSTRAVVDYGYDETLQCMSRLDVCVANGNATTATDPFYYASETYTGASCSSGCTININVHPGGRVLYYRRRYLNSSNVTVATESTPHVLAVP